MKISGLLIFTTAFSLFLFSSIKAQDEGNPATAQALSTSPDESIFDKFNSHFSTKTEKNDKIAPIAGIEAIALAKERRKALEEVAKKNPAKVIEEHFKMIETLDPNLLPENVKDFLEKPVQGVGDYYVIAGDDFGEEGKIISSFTDRWVEFNGKKYNAVVYGMKASMGCKKGISIDGIAIGETLVLYDKPGRILKKCKEKAQDKKSDGVIVLFQGKCIKFNSEDDALKFQKAALKAETKPGTGAVEYPTAAEFGGVFQ